MADRQSSIENRQWFFALVACALGPDPALKPGQADRTPEGLAEALWNRLEFARDQAGQDQEVFGALLEDYVASLESGLGSPSSELADCRFSIADCRFLSSEFGVRSSELPGSEPHSAAFEVPAPDSPAAESEPSANIEPRMPNPELGNRQSSIENRQSANSEPRTPNSELRNRQSAIENRQFPSPESPAPSPGLTALATDLVVLLRADDDGIRMEASFLNFRAKVWIYLMLVTRGIPRESIVTLQPGPPADCGFVDRYLKLGKRRRAQAHDLLDKMDRVSEEWERWKPVIESGDIRKLAIVEGDVNALVGQLLRLQAGRRSGN